MTIRIDAYNIQGGYHFADLVDTDDEVIASSGDIGQNAYHEKSALRVLLQVVEAKAPEHAEFVKTELLK